MEVYMTPERKEYIGKLEAQMNVIDRILKMESGTVVSLDQKKKLRELRQEVSSVLKKLKNDEFEIAVVGMEKAGKSTFANALIKTNILPTKGARCTFTSTQIEYSGDEQSDSATVSFYTSDTFNQDFKDKLRTIGFPNYERYSFDTLDKNLYESTYENSVSDANKKAYGKTIHEDILAIITHADQISQMLGRPEISCPVPSDDLTLYITDEVKARVVKQVVIRSKELHEMKNAVIFDVPGFNSPTELHKVQTRERMKVADAIVVVANGSRPSLTGESLEILTEADDEGNQLQDKLFVFANQVGNVKDEKELRENIDTTYKEWCDKNFISRSKKDSRIIFGSALAYLQAKGLETGSNGLNEIKDWEKTGLLPDGDGIEAIRKNLIAYNRTERFEVLKRRVNRIKADIINAFREIRTGSGNITNPGYGSEQIVGRMYFQISPKAETGLLSLREQVRSTIPAERPLSKKIIEYVNQNVTKEKYSISDEEMEEIRLKVPYTDDLDDVSRMENAIREKKFNDMYDDFSENVINIADQYHTEYSEKILEIILNAMDVEPSSPYYEELKQILKEQVTPFRGGVMLSSGESSGIYYQSLIERFSRDIYEVLILSQYNDERLRKFYKSKNNFFSMSVFYQNPTGTKSYAPTQDNLMCNMLLFHHYADMDNALRRFSDELVKITGIKKIPDDIWEYAQKAFIALNGSVDNILHDVKKAFEKAKGSPEDFCLNLLKSRLYSSMQDDDQHRIDDEENFTQYYKEYHSKLRDGKQTSLEDVRREFDTDIEILQNILLNAFITAVDMEKPFVAREFKSIDDIISKYIKNGAFNDFLIDNFRKIKYEETSKLDKERRVQEQNIAIIQEINSILDTLNQ